MGIGFEWDETKAADNLAKHGISFWEATTVFNDPLSGTVPDPDHSDEENRFITIGTSHVGRLIVVVHTDRSDNTRIISARTATHREKKQYAES